MTNRRRGQNEGSVYKRTDGRWCAAVSMGNGQRKYVYGATAAETRDRLHRLKQHIAEGRPPESKVLTVNTVAQQYLASLDSKVKSTTHRRYETLLRLHVLPIIGHAKLDTLQPGQLETVYSIALSNGRSPQTVVHVHRVVHSMLRQAERWQLINRNVASLVKPPRVPHREMRILNKAEVREFLRVARGSRLEAMWQLAIGTGMRSGEMFGLQWKSVDLDRGMLTVRATLEWRARQGPRLSEPKSRRSRRQLHLTPSVVKALHAHRTRQLEEQLRLGAAWQDSGFVFTSITGTPLRTENVTRRYFKPLLRAALIDQAVRVHDLRHTAISLALSAGVAPTDVADMAGHSVAVTLQRYAHALPGAPMRAANAIEAIVHGI